MIRNTTDDDEAWLAAAWKEAREYASRTLSNVTVTGRTGARLFEVTPLASDPGKSQVVLRDEFGHDLLKNDTNAGWGLASPQNGYSSYPAFPLVKGTSGTFTEAWLYGGFTYTNTIQWAYIHGTEFSDTFSECRMEWAPDITNWQAIPNSTTQSNEDVSNPATVYTIRSGTFDLPLVASGNFFGVRLVQRKASGSGTNVYCTPVYLNAVG